MVGKSSPIICPGNVTVCLATVLKTFHPTDSPLEVWRHDESNHQTVTSVHDGNGRRVLNVQGNAHEKATRVFLKHVLQKKPTTIYQI